MTSWIMLSSWSRRMLRLWTTAGWMTLALTDTILFHFDEFILTRPLAQPSKLRFVFVALKSTGGEPDADFGGAIMQTSAHCRHLAAWCRRTPSWFSVSFFYESFMTGVSTNDIHRLQRVQICLVFCLTHNSHLLTWLPIHQRVAS